MVRLLPSMDGIFPSFDERKGWYREERHGREVEVGEIAVHRPP